jgi:hypothetical protein
MFNKEKRRQKRAEEAYAKCQYVYERGKPKVCKVIAPKDVSVEFDSNGDVVLKYNGE